MSEKIKHLNDGDFTESIEKGIALVDFWAEWCMPCRMQGPILEQVAEEIGDKARIYKLDVDHNPNTASTFRITGIPTLILFKDGVPVKTFVGVQRNDVLVKEIKALA